MSNILTNNINARSGNRIAIGKAGDIVSIAGSLSYEDVTSVDSVGLITARSGIHVTGAGSSVGIGTDDPEQTLHVRGDIRVKTNRPVVRYKSLNNAHQYFAGADVNDTFDGGYQIGVGHGIGVGAAGTTAFCVTSDARIGIGTTAPNYKTQIFGGSDSQENVLFTVQSNGVSNTGNLKTTLRLTNSTSNSSVHAADISAIRSTNAETLVFSLYNGGAAPVERMRIDDSGRVGINTTAFADSATALYIKNGASGSEHTFFDIECDTNESCRVRFSEDGSTYPGEIRYTTLSHELQFYVSSGQRMFIDSTGRIGINTDTFNDAAEALRVNAPSGQANAHLTIKSNNSGTGQSILNFGDDDFNEGRIVYAHSDNSMRFVRNDKEHMRMDGSLRHFAEGSSDRFTVKNANTSSGSSAFDISNNATGVTDGTQVFSIRENGDIYTSGNTSVQALSSERRLKENIELIDRSVSWATIKNTPYYTYNLIGQEGPRYGPIVDEVPAEMVKETDLSDDQGPIRTFDNGMLNARLYVALQEAIAKIETLETKVAALEGN